MGERVRVIFDTDGGVDDCTALWWGLWSETIDIVAVTTVFGNVELDQVNRNVAKVLDAAGRRDVPIAAGALRALGRSPIVADAREVHGEDGLGGLGPPDVDLETVDEAAPELIARVAREFPGEITLVAAGPLTNVAGALHEDPSLATNLRELIVMGGVVAPPGNVTPVAEFNIACDPDAAAEVVGAAWSKSPLLVPLDVTHLATMSDAERDLLAEQRTTAARFLAGPIIEYWPRTVCQTSDGTCPSHDLVALMAAAHPEILQVEELPLAVDTGGSEAWGQTVADLRVRVLKRGALPPELVDLARRELLDGASIWRVALGADVEQFRARLRPLLGG